MRILTLSFFHLALFALCFSGVTGRAQDYSERLQWIVNNTETTYVQLMQMNEFAELDVMEPYTVRQKSRLHDILDKLGMYRYGDISAGQFSERFSPYQKDILAGMNYWLYGIVPEKGSMGFTYSTNLLGQITREFEGPTIARAKTYALAKKFGVPINTEISLGAQIGQLITKMSDIYTNKLFYYTPEQIGKPYSYKNLPDFLSSTLGQLTHDYNTAGGAIVGWEDVAKGVGVLNPSQPVGGWVSKGWDRRQNFYDWYAWNIYSNRIIQARIYEALSALTESSELPSVQEEDMDKPDFDAAALAELDTELQTFLYTLYYNLELQKENLPELDVPVFTMKELDEDVEPLIAEFKGAIEQYLPSVEAEISGGLELIREQVDTALTEPVKNQLQSIADFFAEPRDTLFTLIPSLSADFGNREIVTEAIVVDLAKFQSEPVRSVFSWIYYCMAILFFFQYGKKTVEDCLNILGTGGFTNG